MLWKDPLPLHRTQYRSKLYYFILKIFHTENWWNEEDQYFNFRFKDGKSYHVYIGFDNDLVEEKEEALFDLVIYDDADQLVLYNEEGDNWDYWDIR